MDNLINTPVKSVLISLFYKEPARELILKLNSLGIKIYSTGGTLDYIRELGAQATAVEEITEFPSIFGGRVKTLHPNIFGGILFRRDNPDDIREQQQYNIPPIDMVIVDLYPFEETIKKGATDQEIIEKIDIGGISLIRAAAKNFHHTWIVPSSAYFSAALEIIQQQGAQSSLEQRKLFAGEAFNISSHYDTAIFDYMSDASGQVFKKSIQKSRPLRYGENPHQQASFFGHPDEAYQQLHGKEISYNNLLDIDAAFNLISEFEEPTFAIIKHNNACGVASRPSLEQAYKDALASDPVSAFGGILIANRNIEKDSAYHINELFFEVILAPEFSDEALEILKQKKNRIILKTKPLTIPQWQYRSALNGVLVQSGNFATTPPESWRKVTNQKPDDIIEDDLVFANKIVKHTKSNAIVLAKNKQLLASGTGQTSRVDALKQAIARTKEFGHSLENAVMASDAFFPFDDCVKIAHNEQINAIIQPGGSVRDNDSIDYCDANNMIMVMTGIRHFKH